MLGVVVGIPAGQMTSPGTVAKSTLRVAGKTAKVDVNLADREEIGRLPGMTAQIVDRIIQNRPYRKLDELVSKKVMGKKQFAEIREYIAVGPNGL